MTLARRGTLDRDLVIEIDEAAVPHHALIAPDGDGWVLVATPTLKLDAAEQRPLALEVYSSCSG